MAPTLDYLTGFNPRSLATAGGGLIDILAGSPSPAIDTATVRRVGGSSLKIAVADPTTAVWARKTLPTSSSTFVVVGYVYFSSLDGGTGDFITVRDTVSGRFFGAYVTINTIGYLYNDGTLHGSSGSATVSTGIWYRVEFDVDASTTAWAGNIRIYVADSGTLFDSQIITGSGGTTTTFTELTLGVGNYLPGGAFGPTATFYLTDIAVSSQLSDYPIGPIQVLGYSPNAVGTHNLDATTSSFFFSDTSAPPGSAGTALTTSETTSYQMIDDVPIDGGTDAVKIITTLSAPALNTPSFRSAGAWSFTANNVSASGSLSPGAPAGKAVGDLLVLVAESRGIGVTVTTPSGWSLVTNFPKASGTASGGKIYMFTRIADGTASDTPSVSYSGATSGTSGDSTGAGILAFINATGTLDATAISQDLSAQGSTSTITGITTATDESLVVNVAIKILESSGQTSSVTTYTEASDNSTTSGTGHIVETSYKIQTAHGASGSGTITWSATSSARALIATIALKASTSQSVIQPTNTWYAEYNFADESTLAVDPYAIRAIVAQELDTAVASTWAAKLFDSVQGSNTDDISNGTISTTTRTYVGKTFPQRPLRWLGGQDSTANLVSFGNATGLKYAQSLNDQAGALTGIGVILSKSGSPIDNIKITLQTDSGGVPSGTVLATSNSVSGSTLSTLARTIYFTFGSSPILSSGTVYWLVIERDGAQDAGNSYLVQIDASNSYSGGGAYGQNSLSVWNAYPSGDIALGLGSIWTLAALNGIRLRFGYTASASGDPRLADAMLEAAFPVQTATAYTESATITSTSAPTTTTGPAAFVESGSIVGKSAPSASEIYTPGSTVYTESATISSNSLLSATEVHEIPDSTIISSVTYIPIFPVAGYGGLSNNAQGGVDGVTPTISDTGSGDPFTQINLGPTAAILQYSADNSLHGFSPYLGYKMATRGTAELSNAQWTNGSSVSDSFGRFYVWLNGVSPTSQTVLMRVRQSGTNIGTIRISTALKILIANAAGSTIYTSTNSITGGDTYRIEFEVVTGIGGSNTAATIRFWLYQYDNTDFNLIEDSGAIAIVSGATLTHNIVEFGPAVTNTANVPSSTGFLYYYDLVAFAPAKVGPVLYTDIIQAVDANTSVTITSISTNEIYTPGGTAYTESTIVNSTSSLSAVEIVQFTDTAIVATKASLSSADIAAYIDQSIAGGVTSLSAIDIAAFVDSATALGVSTPSAAEISQFVDSQTCMTATTIAATETAQYVESATIAGTTSITTTAEIHEIPDSGTVPVATTVVSIDIATYVDSNTIQGSTTPSASETATYIDSQSLTSNTSVSFTETSQIVDSATNSTITKPSSADIAAYVDSSSLNGATSVLSTELHELPDSNTTTATTTITSTDILSAVDNATTTSISIPSATDTKETADSNSGATVTSVAPADTTQYVESAIAATVGSIASTDVTAFVDSSTATSASSITTIEGHDVPDAGTVGGGSNVSAVEIAAFTESNSIAVTSASSATEISSYIDAATLSGLTALFSADVGIITDTGTVVSTSGGTATDVVGYLDADTLAGTTSIDSTELKSSGNQDQDTRSTTTQLTYAEIAHFVDQLTVSSTSSTSTIEVHEIPDSSTTSGITSVSSVDVAVLIESGQVDALTTTSSSDTAIYSDAALWQSLTTVSAGETAAISDSDAISGNTVPTSFDTAQFVETSTFASTTQIVTVETHEIPDSATGSSETSITSTEVASYVDAQTATGVSNATAIEIREIPDSSTTDSRTTISAIDTAAYVDQAAPQSTATVSYIDVAQFVDSATNASATSVSADEQKLSAGSETATVTDTTSITSADITQYVDEDSSSIVTSISSSEGGVSDSGSTSTTSSISSTETYSASDFNNINGSSSISVLETSQYTETSTGSSTSTVSYSDTSVFVDASALAITTQLTSSEVRGTGNFDSATVADLTSLSYVEQATYLDFNTTSSRSTLQSVEFATYVDEATTPVTTYIQIDEFTHSPTIDVATVIGMTTVGVIYEYVAKLTELVAVASLLHWKPQVLGTHWTNPVLPFVRWGGFSLRQRFEQLAEVGSRWKP